MRGDCGRKIVAYLRLPPLERLGESGDQLRVERERLGGERAPERFAENDSWICRIRRRTIAATIALFPGKYWYKEPMLTPASLAIVFTDPVFEGSGA